MIIDKIKDNNLRKRIQGYRDNFPRDLAKSSKAMKNPNVAKMMAELIKDDNIVCLPKDKVIRINTRIDEPEDLVLPSKILDHFIENTCHRVIMNFCICRESMECEDYPREFGCIFMGEAAKQIHPELGRSAGVEETKAYAQRVREAGLVHKIGRSKLDSIWLNVAPDHKLLTVCNCCPCCCMARAVPFSGPLAKEAISTVPGVNVTVTDECIGCGECLENICIFQAITLEDGRAVINLEDCQGCGRCVEACPQDAIEISIDESEFVQMTIERISNSVDYK